MLSERNSVDIHALERQGMTIIEHPPGEETQFDWVELPDTPTPYTHFCR